MNVTVERLMQIIGQYVVEIALLRDEIAALKQALAQVPKQDG